MQPSPVSLVRGCRTLTIIEFSGEINPYRQVNVLAVPPRAKLYWRKHVNPESSVTVVVQFWFKFYFPMILGNELGKENTI